MITMRPDPSTRPRRPRTFTRKLFVADAAIAGDRATLRVRRGAHCTTIAADGSPISETRDARSVLWTNIGEYLVVCGPSVDETIAAEVVGIEPNATTLHVRLLGELAERTRVVQLMRVKPAPHPRRRAA